MANAKEKDKPLEAEKPAAAAAPNPAVDFLDEFEQAAGAGFEDVRSDDAALPFFRLLQSLSPETKRAEAEYVRGAAEGMWFDTVSRALYHEITFVPVKMVTHYIEWKTRKAGGGFVRNHGMNAGIMAQCVINEETGRNTLQNGNEVIETSHWFGLVVKGKAVNPDKPDAVDAAIDVDLMVRAVLSFAITAQRESRRWLADAQALRKVGRAGNMFMPPMYAMSYILSSKPTKNDQGSWSLPKIDRGGWIQDYPNALAILSEAKLYAEFAKVSHVAAAPTNMAAPAQREAIEGPRDVTPPSRTVDDEIPF
jgi:hypothetical protein